MLWLVLCVSLGSRVLGVSMAACVPRLGFSHVPARQLALGARQLGLGSGKSLPVPSVSPLLQSEWVCVLSG